MKKGDKISKHFELVNKIRSLDELWEAINKDVSIYARHKVCASAFFYSWHLKLVKQWIDNGWFWTVKRIENDPN